MRINKIEGLKEKKAIFIYVNHFYNFIGCSSGNIEDRPEMVVDEVVNEERKKLKT